MYVLVCEIPNPPELAKPLLAWECWWQTLAWVAQWGTAFDQSPPKGIRNTAGQNSLVLSQWRQFLQSFCALLLRGGNVLSLKLFLTCICMGLLMSLPIRNLTQLFCSSSCSNNPYSLTMCTSQNHPSPNFKSSQFQRSSPPSPVALASTQTSLSPSMEWHVFAQDSSAPTVYSSPAASSAMSTASQLSSDLILSLAPGCSWPPLLIVLFLSLWLEALIYSFTHCGELFCSVSTWGTVRGGKKIL